MAEILASYRLGNVNTFFLNHIEMNFFYDIQYLVGTAREDLSVIIIYLSIYLRFK